MDEFNYDEIKRRALADFKRRNKELEDWLMRDISKFDGKGFLENLTTEVVIKEPDIPIWRRAFETLSESGKPTEKDIWILDEENGFLIKIPAGSTTAQCLLLRELELLPKEEGL